MFAVGCKSLWNFAPIEPVSETRAIDDDRVKSEQRAMANAGT